jgi:hypothetical protein
VTTFQFDECISSKALIRDCRRSGLCTPRRYPKGNMGLKDPEMLAKYMPGDAPLFTQDLALLSDHATHIPPRNSGIIMIGHSPATPRTVTEVSIRRILKQFKQRFGEWHSISWRNSIVVITEATVSAGHMSASGPSVNFIGRIDDNTWKDRLKEVLANNAGL